MAYPLIAGEFFTNVGRGATLLSLALYLYRLTGNVWAIAIACLSELVLSLLLRKLSGTLIDGFGARLVLAASAAMLALLFLPLPFAGDLYRYNVALALLLALAMNALRIVSSAASYAGVVSYARGREESVNSALAVSMQAGQFGGMALAGLTLELGSVNLAGLAIACSYALAALCFAALPARAAGATGGAPQARAKTSLLATLSAHPQLARYSLLGALDYALVGVFNLVLAPVVALAFAGAARWMGILDAIFTVGALAGGAALALIWKRMQRQGWLISMLSCATAAAALLSMVTLKGMPLYACVLLFGFTVNVSYMFWMTSAQTVTPVEDAGRIGAMRTVVNGLALALVSGAVAAMSPLGIDNLRSLALALPLAFLILALCLSVPVSVLQRRPAPR